MSRILFTGGGSTWAGTPQAGTPCWAGTTLLGRYPLGRYSPSRYNPQAGTIPRQVHTPWVCTPPLKAVHAGSYGQQAGGTHPTGMLSCVLFVCVALMITVLLPFLSRNTLSSCNERLIWLMPLTQAYSENYTETQWSQWSCS